jgi:hypothetical protein
VVWERANMQWILKKSAVPKMSKLKMWDHDAIEPKDKIKRCSLTA